MITRITIRNFRSLEDVTVDLDPVTVLIGRSGTGKSNFVRAVRFLRDCLNGRQTDFSAVGGERNIFPVRSDGGILSYRVEMTIEGMGRLDYSLGIQRNGSIDHESLWDGGERTYFLRSARKWEVAPATSPVPSLAGLMLGAIPGLLESTVAFVAIRSGIGCYDFPGVVLQNDRGGSADPHDFGFGDRGDNYLPVAERIVTDISKLPNWRNIGRSMAAVNRAVSGLTLNMPGSDRLDVAHLFGEATFPLDIRQESEGFRRYLAHLLALYQNPSKQTLIFEHPEMGLHPGALEALADEFKACPRNGRGQVILTTHSPELLDQFDASAIRVVDIENQRTRIGPLISDQLELLRDNLLHPGELLTFDPARLPAGAEAVPA